MHDTNGTTFNSSLRSAMSPTTITNNSKFSKEYNKIFNDIHTTMGNSIITTQGNETQGGFWSNYSQKRPQYKTQTKHILLITNENKTKQEKNFQQTKPDDSALIRQRIKNNKNKLMHFLDKTTPNPHILHSNPFDLYHNKHKNNRIVESLSSSTSRNDSKTISNSNNINRVIGKNNNTTNHLYSLSTSSMINNNNYYNNNSSSYAKSSSSSSNATNQTVLLSKLSSKYPQYQLASHLPKSFCINPSTTAATSSKEADSYRIAKMKHFLTKALLN